MGRRAARGRPPPVWVTARRNRGNVAIDYRTDYVFASRQLGAQARRRPRIPVDGASDHEAIEASFDV